MNSWLKIFFRNFKRRPLYPLVNLLGLTAGITCFLLAMLYVSHEFSYEKWNPNAENIYRPMLILDDGQIFTGTPEPMPAAVTDAYSEITDWTIVRNEGGALVSYEDNSIYGEEIIVANNWFEFFPFPFKYGDPITCLQNKNGVAISEEIATKIFGDENPLGKTVKLRNKEVYEVTGVFTIKGNNTEMDVENIIRGVEKASYLEGRWGDFSHDAYYKTTENFDVNKMNAELTDFYLERGAKAAGETVEEYRGQYTAILEMERLADVHLYAAYMQGKGTDTIFILSLLSFLILLISSINFINLSISGATKRAKEVAVRKTLGSSRQSIVNQFVLEVAVLCVIALAISLALTEILLPAFSNLLDAEMQITDVLADLPLLFAVILTILLLAGLFPALYLANFNPVKVLKGNFSRSKSGAIVKKGMIVFQFAASAIFLVGAFIVNKQLTFMNNKDLGFNKERVLLIESASGDDVMDKKGVFRNELGKISGVEGAFLSDRPPGAYNRRGSVSQVYQDGTMFATDLHFVDENFFPSLNIPILQGRNLDDKMVFDTIGNKVLVNETFVKLYELEDPIGKEIVFWGDYRSEIVGVVKDYITKGFDHEITPAVYNMAYRANFVLVKMKSENLEGTIASIEDLWTSEIEPGFPFRYEFLDENFAELYSNETKLKSLIGYLSFIMVLIALLGLFAVATHTIQQRYKEVAIRKTIGASDSQLLGGLIKDFAIICLIAALIALPVAYVLVTGWLEGFSYRIDMPLLPYIVVPVLLLLLTVLMVWSQASRALKVDLVTYLKYE